MWTYLPPCKDWKTVRRKKKTRLNCSIFFFFLTKPKEAEPNTRFEGWPQIVSCNENWEERNNPKSVRTKFDLNKAVRSFSTSKKQSTFPYFLFHLKNPLSLRICKKLPRDYLKKKKKKTYCMGHPTCFASEKQKKKPRGPTKIPFKTRVTRSWIWRSFYNFVSETEEGL